MAFVYRAERKFHNTSTEPNNLSPGQYTSTTTPFTPDTFSLLKHPPFNSSSERKTSFIPKVDSHLGPGSYEKKTLPPQIQFLPKAQNKFKSKKPPPINFYNVLEKKVLPPSLFEAIQKTNEIAFNTHGSRFDDKINQILTSQKHNPGPGTYNIPTDFDVIVNKSKVKGNKVSKDMFACTTGPTLNERILSIPNKESFGYEYIDDKLIMLPDPDYEIKTTGIGEDTVGPGKYDVPSIWDKNVITWDRMSDKKVSNTIEISLEKDKQNISHQQSKTSTSFIKKPNLKKNMIETFINQRYNLNNTVQINKQKQSDIFLDDSTATPGPGYYTKDFNQFDTSLFDKSNQYKHSFNSSANRFPKRSFTTDNIAPGMYYNLNKPIKPKHNYNSIHKSNLFNGIQQVTTKEVSGLDAFSNKKDTTNELGPGAYDIRKTMVKGKVSKVEEFGSKEKRFIKGGIFELGTFLETPGPGSYIGNEEYNTGMTDEELKNQQKLEEYIKKKEKEENDNKIKIEKFETPGVGHYNVAIARSILYKIKSSINQFQDNKKISFGSQDKRFRPFLNKNDIKNNPIIGPGIYYKEKLPSVKPNKVPFNIGNTRFIYQEHNNILPGPGTYEHESPTDWNTKSHNVLFV